MPEAFDQDRCRITEAFLVKGRLSVTGSRLRRRPRVKRVVTGFVGARQPVKFSDGDLLFRWDDSPASPSRPPPSLRRMQRPVDRQVLVAQHLREHHFPRFFHVEALIAERRRE
jgi:hypothetical protein